MRGVVVGLFGVLLSFMFLCGLVMLITGEFSGGLSMIFAAILLAMIVDTWRVSQETRETVREQAELLEAIAARVQAPRLPPPAAPFAPVKAEVARKRSQKEQATERVALQAVSDSRPADWGVIEPKLR